MTTKTQPFWEDEPTWVGARVASNTRVMELGVGLTITATLLTVALLPALILLAISPWLALAWVIFMAVALFFNFRQRQRQRRLIAKIADIQQRAQARAHAAYIGSAIHVAGHPVLKRDQPIVLALTEGGLAFYDYTSQTPIDTLPIPQLLTAQTVVYDDERVPHVDVIDSAAQALQLTFTRNGQTGTCLFRQMRKVRPVDWYHALQQAKHGALQT